ncbi:pyridoxamine 5'-phosphate oxidase family protein [Mobilicoccus massiliensis]|uniref:pyridoxamine 5'-phosphate oxidase family protein n=1 Tax=Mobilicoccus massiliensis TaxID=1522310 RepID=UPI0005907C9D|nr:pyridoxamine 5'-phosphate oxidase family protein [Mobilicoccus massiliensis]
MSDDQTKIRKIVEKAKFAMMATLGDDGLIVSRPMTPQEVGDDWTILFVTQRAEDVALQAEGKPVNLAFVDGMDFVSITGTGEIRDDVDKKKELWGPANEAYTQGGPENPDNVILAVHCTSARYWDSPAAPVALVSMLKAAVTGDKPGAGEAGTVPL